MSWPRDWDPKEDYGPILSRAFCCINATVPPVLEEWKGRLTETERKR